MRGARPVVPLVPQVSPVSRWDHKNSCHIGTIVPAADLLDQFFVAHTPTELVDQDEQSWLHLVGDGCQLPRRGVYTGMIALPGWWPGDETGLRIDFVYQDITATVVVGKA